MKRIKPRQILRRSRHSGAAAIEFALIFPILLAVAYASLVYSYVFFLQQSINFAAQQGVQAAVAVVSTTDAATDAANRQTQARNVALSILSWLPPTQVSLVSTPAVSICPGTTTSNQNTFSFEVEFALGGGTATSLFPSLVNLPFFGGSSVPPLPNTLMACAVAFT
jgi:Flp pilus assembly protein TadG